MTDNILSLLLNAYYQLDNELQDSLSKKGWQHFSHSQSMIFLNMAEGRDRAVDIAKHMGISKQAINRTIKDLVESGMIKLIPDTKDKRSKRIVLTERGALITRDATSGLEELENRLAEALGTKKTVQLKQLLQTLAQAKT